MRDISIEKIVLNIGCGTKQNIENAKSILERISERTAVITKGKKRSLFGVPKGKPIGTKVTIRGNTNEVFSRLLKAVENTLASHNFDVTGNLSFGVKEYIDVPDMQYDPKVGIIGFDVCVRLVRPGYRISKKRMGSSLGKKHRITKNDAIKYIQEKFGVKMEEE